MNHVINNKNTDYERYKKDVYFGCYLFLVCFLLANLEIQIEGPNGWASNLPTWKTDNPIITWIFVGKPVTGYHIFLNLLLLILFHFPFLFQKYSAMIEFKILYSYIIICVVWDYHWFIMNPYFGLQKFKAGNIWWFKNWLAGFPLDYYLGVIFSLILYISPVIFSKVRLKRRLYSWFTITLTLFLLTMIMSIIVKVL